MYLIPTPLYPYDFICFSLDSSNASHAASNASSRWLHALDSSWRPWRSWAVAVCEPAIDQNEADRRTRIRRMNRSVEDLLSERNSDL